MQVSMPRSLKGLLLIAVAPAALAAQQQQAPAEVQAWIAEIQEIEQQLAPIQARALEDEELQQAQTELNAAIVAAIRESGPQGVADLRRVETIQPEIEAAQQSGDEDQIESLVEEAQQLQQRISRAQADVLQEPQLAAQAEAFQSQLRTRMVELDPEAGALLSRYLVLQDRIVAAMEGRPGR